LEAHLVAVVMVAMLMAVEPTVMLVVLVAVQLLF
jgi:hypothetical protein